MHRETNAEFLRRLAQNDYMVDTQYTDDGNRLVSIADDLETAADNIRSLRSAYPQYGAGPQMWDGTLELVGGATCKSTK